MALLSNNLNSEPGECDRQLLSQLSFPTHLHDQTDDNEFQSFVAGVLQVEKGAATGWLEREAENGIESCENMFADLVGRVGMYSRTCQGFLAGGLSAIGVSNVRWGFRRCNLAVGYSIPTFLGLHPESELMAGFWQDVVLHEPASEQP